MLSDVFACEKVAVQVACGGLMAGGNLLDEGDDTFIRFAVNSVPVASGTAKGTPTGLRIRIVCWAFERCP